MTPDRLVNLGRIAMHPKRLAFSISDISVFTSFISSGTRKLVCRRLGEGRIFFIYFQPSCGILVSFDRRYNSKWKYFLQLKLVCNTILFLHLHVCRFYFSCLPVTVRWWRCFWKNVAVFALLWDSAWLPLSLYRCTPLHFFVWLNWNCTWFAFLNVKQTFKINLQIRTLLILDQARFYKLNVIYLILCYTCWTL